tara:strand:+ start:4437 stop:4865 length:429 start_codon:yes stop_codon:yes gene_type:complete
MGPQELMLKRIAKDPFLKYFKPIQGPSGAMGFSRRLGGPPSNPAPDPGVTRQAADIYKTKTGKAYSGKLLPIAQDSTYKSSSFGKADAVKAVAQAKEFRRTASQKTLFGGDVRTLFPSQRRDLTRRRTARKQAEKTRKTLGT